MNTDPLASMRCWAVDVEIGDAVYTIPPLPAADWWPVLADGGPAAMIDLLPPGQDIDDRMMAGEISVEDLASAFLDAIEEVCGRSRGEAEVIAGYALGGWGWVGGRLALAGFRWDVMPIAAALDAMHTVLMEHLTDEGRKKYEKLLSDAAPAKIDKEQALSDFEAAAGPRPKPAPLRSSAAPSADPQPRTRRPPQPPRRRAPSAGPMPSPEPPAESAPAARSDTPPA